MLNENNNNQGPPQQPTNEDIMQLLTINFEKIDEKLNFLAQGSAVIFGQLIHLINAENAPETLIGHDVVQGYLDTVEEEDTLNPMPSTSSMALSSRSTSSEAGSSRKSSAITNVICADCKKVFVRGSLTDSITKHAKETSCKPFGCGFCLKLFKKVNFL